MSDNPTSKPNSDPANNPSPATNSSSAPADTPADHPFYRLAPFIQEFIYRAGWAELRNIQVQASKAIFDTPGHVLITSGTASGKTEAAFLPILTQLHNHPSESIGVLYIGPLKALLNDQFQRLHDLLTESNIPVQSWHGDVATTKRQNFLKLAQGVLQITPESLEAMLIQRQTELIRLFGDLRYVVIDEVHAFISSDRGRQVICQLQRLARYHQHPDAPSRRVGLSATIGVPEQAMQWLAGGTTLPVTLVNDTASRRPVMLGLEHYDDLPRKYDQMLIKAHTSGDAPKIAALEQMKKDSEILGERMFQMTQAELKTLVFANSRGETESTTTTLRRLADLHHMPDIYHIHHGSISAPLREAAEAAMQAPDSRACVIATITLELGIDLGQLDQVLQLHAPPSVASFVQRLGRSGRRGNPAKLFFFSHEEVEDETAHLGKQFPWDLLQTIAIVQLYVEEHWLEPPDLPKMPLSLLYHQTMSILVAKTELTPPELAEQVLTLAPFAAITQDQYRELLRYLLETKHLERTETGGLIVGLQAEKIVNNYHFYATFKDESVYIVRDASRAIGTIQYLPGIGDRVALGGRAWKVTGINSNQQTIMVEGVAGSAPPNWRSGGSPLYTRVVERVRQVLLEDQVYSYLQPRAIQRLASARQLARDTHLTTDSILPLGGDRYMILPWQGSRTVSTLTAMLSRRNVPAIDSNTPFYFDIVEQQSSVGGLRAILQAVADDPPTAAELVADLTRVQLEKDKYDEFIPDSLLRQAIIADHLDTEGAVAALQRICAAASTSKAAPIATPNKSSKSTDKVASDATPNVISNTDQAAEEPPVGKP